MASERKPRLCIMTKGDNGYGFHLHGEKGKSGQLIRKVEHGSPAEASGLRAGDRVIAVNGVNVVQRIKAVDNETRLLVVDHDTHESLRSLRLTATEEMAIIGTGAPYSSSPQASPSPTLPSVPSTPSKKRENGSVSKQPVPLSSQVQKPTRRSPSKAAKKRIQAESLHIMSVTLSSVLSDSSASSHDTLNKMFAFMSFAANFSGNAHLQPFSFSVSLTDELQASSAVHPLSVPHMERPEALAQAEAQGRSQSRVHVDPSELVPRLCHLVRSEMGYGFNLHSDRSRPGQYIRSMDPGSPADHAGLRPQDRLIEVNGVNIEGMRHAEVVAFIKKGGDETWLLVVDPDTDEHFKRKGVVPSVSHLKDYDGPSISNGSPSPHINGSSTTQSIRSTHSDLSSQGNSTQLADDEASRLLDPFAEMGLSLSATAAEEKMKIHAKEKKKAPQMDWMKKYELFSNF
ncbi:hypothetical protein PAMP_009309 [Pampus punctatissimus]